MVRDRLSERLVEWCVVARPALLHASQPTILVAWAIYFAFTCIKLKDAYEAPMGDPLLQPWCTKPAASKIIIINDYIRKQGRMKEYEGDLAWPMEIAKWTLSCRAHVNTAVAQQVSPSSLVEDAELLLPDVEEPNYFKPGPMRLDSSLDSLLDD